MTTNAWPKEIEPLDGEVVLWHRKASRAQTLRRVVGGTLFLTSRRLLFRPHVVDRALNGLIWATTLDDIAAVDVAPRDWKDYRIGGLRRRLRMITHSGTLELLVVNKVDAVAEEIRQATKTH